MFVPDDSEESGFRVEDFIDDAQAKGYDGADLVMSPRVKRN